MTWFKELQRTSGVNWHWPVILDWMLSNARGGGGGGGAQTRKNLRWLAGDKSERVQLFANIASHSLFALHGPTWFHLIYLHMQEGNNEVKGTKRADLHFILV